MNALTHRASIKSPLPKRKHDETPTKCVIKKFYTSAQIGLTSANEFWSGKYTALQDECRAHGVTQCGTLGEKLTALRAHYHQCHVENTYKSKAVSLSD